MDWSAGLLSFLASVTVRSLCLVILAAAGLLALRVKAASARHAVFTMAVAGMLALAALAPLMPAIPLRVLRTSVEPEFTMPADAPLQDAPSAVPQPAVAAPKDGAAFTWQQAAASVYLLGLLGFLARLTFSYLFTVRLVRASRPIDQPWAADVYESTWLSVPITVGWLRPKILLPAGWEAWDDVKLQAVLAHERTHIARADWAISILAGLNRCLFWFNPLAWWLERNLASLAEEACDDAALLLVESEHYAQALLDMAAAVKTGQGRLIWEAMAMAKAVEVRKRIERILDETRQIPRAVTGARWAALVACSLPLIYVAAVVQLVPASAQEPPKTPAAMNEYLKGKRQLTPVDVSNMEQYLVANPHDLEVRSQLVVYYFMNGVREARTSHILWLIANHPESNQAAFTAVGISPRSNQFNDVADYIRASALWRQQIAAKSDDARVLNNAAQFFSQPGGDFDEAERLLLKVRSQSFNLVPDSLGKLYASAILGATGDRRFVDSNPKMADRLKAQLETSSDAALVWATGTALASVARRPTRTEPLPPGALNLDDHPMLIPAVDLGQRLLARARDLGVQAAATGALPPPAAASPRFLGNGTTQDVVASAYQLFAALPAAPQPVSKVDAEYPALARQVRIQGDVRLVVVLGSDGKVSNMEVNSGHPLLIPKALEAVKQWSFPAGSAGRFGLLIPFRLDGGNAPLPQPRSMGDMVGGVGGGIAGSVPGGIPAGMPGGVMMSGPQGGVPGGVVGGVMSRPTDMPQRIRVGSNVQAARLLARVEPIYPAEARAAQLEGTVTMDITIAEDGTVESVKPTSGHPLLAAAAQDAVRQWVYQVTTLSGQRVKVITSVTLPFELNQ